MARTTESATIQAARTGGTKYISEKIIGRIRAGSSQFGQLTFHRPIAATPALQPVGEVIRIGPDGSFAIISYGRQSGAEEGQTLSIHRDQQKVALVSITQITNDFSIA